MSYLKTLQTIPNIRTLSRQSGSMFVMLVVLMMQAENEALQALVLEVAPDKTEAQDKVAQLKERCKHLLVDVRNPSLSPFLSLIYSL
jgi:hypothetical protein